MPLANYSTSVEATKTVGEIMGILVAHGAREILMNYSKDGVLENLSFIVETPYGNMPIRLPVDAAAVLKVMGRDPKIPRHQCHHAQAVRVAWRILKDWVRAQMALLETEMVRMEQIFLPYMVTPDNKTLYENMAEKKFYLTGGKETLG